MNCLIWNCLWLRNLCTWKELRDIIQAKDPSVVFIAKKLADEARLDSVQRNIDFDNNKKKGGFKSRLRCWFSSLLEVISEFGGGWFITLLHAWIDKGSNNEWRFTGFFGELDTSRKIEAWDSFRNLITTQMYHGYVQEILMSILDKILS